MTDEDAALVQQFLDIVLAQGKLVIEPEGMPDDAQRKATAVRLAMGHGRPAYPGPIKATQPNGKFSELAEPTCSELPEP